MQFLSAIFVLCFAITSALPLFPEKIGLHNERYDESDIQNAAILSPDKYIELRDYLLKDEFEIFRNKVEEFFGKGTELSKSLIEALEEEGKVSVINFFNRLIGDKQVTKSPNRYFQKSGILRADTFTELRDILRENEDLEIFKKKVEELFGKGTELSESLLEALKEEGRIKVINFFNRLLGDEEITESPNSYFRKSGIYRADTFTELRDILRDNEDLEIFKKKVEELFGKGTELSESFLEALKEEGRIKVINFFNRLLGDEEITELPNSVARAITFNIKDIFKRLRDYILKEDFDAEKFKELVEKLLPNDSLGRSMLDMLRKKDRDVILDFLDRYLGARTDIPSSGSALRTNFYNIEAIFKRLRDYVLKEDFDAEKFMNLLEKLLPYDNGMTRPLLEALKDKGRDYLIEFFDRYLGDRSDIPFPRAIENAGFNFYEILRKLKISILKQVDTEKLKEQVENLFGKGSELAEQLLDILKTNGEKGKYKILELIDRILGESEKKRSIKDIYDKIRDYFKDLHIDLKEKFMKFGEYAKEQYQQVLDKSKTKAENIKKIAQEFLNDGHKFSKEIAEEALGFFREYKQDLGRVYDHIKSKVREIIQKKDR